MPRFDYQAINESGTTISGTIEADSSQSASSILVNRGYIPSRITESGGGEKTGAGRQSLSEKFSTVSTPDLILFTKQLKTMMQAGISILTLLQTMENQTENPKLKRAVAIIADDIKGGASLYEALTKHPKIFSRLYCSMVRSGESSGALPEVLERLTYILEHEHKVKTEIRAALFYPVIVVFFLGIAFFVLLTFVIPKFVDIFLRAGIELPLPTKICMILYQFIAGYWYLLLGGLLIAVVGLHYYFRTGQGKYVRDTTLMKVPIIGPLFIKSAMSRFASIFAILQASGVAVLESISILSGTIGNTAISREFDRIREKLEEGRGISEPLKSARYFPPMVINMVAIGEESGNLDEMLREVSGHYDYEVEYATKRLSDALGPVLTIGLAAVVGFFALAIFLPMWDLTKMVQ